MLESICLTARTAHGAEVAKAAGRRATSVICRTGLVLVVLALIATLLYAYRGELVVMATRATVNLVRFLVDLNVWAYDMKIVLLAPVVMVGFTALMTRCSWQALGDLQEAWHAKDDRNIQLALGQLGTLSRWMSNYWRIGSFICGGLLFLVVLAWSGVSGRGVVFSIENILILLFSFNLPLAWQLMAGPVQGDTCRSLQDAVDEAPKELPRIWAAIKDGSGSVRESRCLAKFGL